MSTLIRRAPWVALGAAAVYYADSENGPARRTRAADRFKALTDTVKDRLRVADVGENGVFVDVADSPITASAPVEPSESVYSAAFGRV